MVTLLKGLQSRAVRQGQSTNQHIQAPLSWQAINQTLSNSGNPQVDYEGFAARWEQEPELKKLVSRFDGQGLILNTPGLEDQPEQGKPKTSGIEQMAKRATAKEFK